MTINVGGAEQKMIEEQDKRIEELEAQVAALEELHQAILSLEGSEGMTDAKFVQWVLLALEKKT